METTEAIIDEWTLEAELGDETVAAVDFGAGPEESLDDVDPWQRLGDVLVRITGSVEVD
jgi:hypothetical protein